MSAKKGNASRKRLWRVIQLLHVVVLLLLLFLYLLYAIERQSGVVYRMVAGTPVERMGLKIIPLLWRHKSFLERQAMNAKLTPAERTRTKIILQKMEMIRPTHLVRLESGEILFGRLRACRNEDCDFLLKSFDGSRMVKRELMKDVIAERKPLVPLSRPMEPRDLRFLLKYEDLNHYYLPPFLFATEGSYPQVFEIFAILSELTDEFRREFGPLVGDGELEAAHICHFSSQKRLAEEAGRLDSSGIINASGFFKKSGNRLFLCDSGHGTEHVFRGAPSLSVFDEVKVQGDSHRITRHEGAHQLASSLGIIQSFQETLLWLEEGIAQYCERIPFSQDHPEKMELLKRRLSRRSLIPWRSLVETPSNRIDAFSEAELQLAYAQSWHLFRTLMTKKYRARFLNFLLERRDADRGAEIPHITIELGNALETTFDELARELDLRISDDGSSE